MFSRTTYNICQLNKIDILFSVITISGRTQDGKFYCVCKCKEGTEWKMVSEIENVIVTHPKKASDNTRLFAMLGEIFHAQEKARDLILEFENKLDKLTSYTKHLEQLKVLYLIWRDPWMTVSKDTYISEMLRIINCHTVPTYSSSRYPSLSNEELYDLQIDVCLLSAEPYPFRDKHLLELELKFDWFGKIQLVDGEMLSWYGSRAILGLDYLDTLAQTLNSDKSTSLWK